MSEDYVHVPAQVTSCPGALNAFHSRGETETSMVMERDGEGKPQSPNGALGRRTGLWLLRCLSCWWRLGFQDSSQFYRDKNSVQLHWGNGVLSTCAGLGIQPIKQWWCLESASCRELACAPACHPDLQTLLSTWIGTKGPGDFPGTCGMWNKESCLKTMRRLQPRFGVSETETLDSHYRVACGIHQNSVL